MLHGRGDEGKNGARARCPRGRDTMAKAKSKLPFGFMSGAIQGIDRTIGRDKGFMLRMAKLRKKKK